MSYKTFFTVVNVELIVGDIVGVAAVGEGFSSAIAYECDNPAEHPKVGDVINVTIDIAPPLLSTEEA